MSERICFVISPIGDPDSETRKRSDQVFKHVIAPAVLALGYHAVRADHISEPGMITSQVIQHIVDDPLVIADLTDRNPNVFYELAIRHAIRKPLVQLIRKGDSIPFDVAGSRTIHVDHRDLDSVDTAKSEIAAQVKSLQIDAGKLETPISVALDLQVLRASSNPEQRSMGDVLAAMTELRAAVGNIDEQLKKSDKLSTIMIHEAFVRRDVENEHMKARLMSASRELREVARQLTILSDTADEAQSKQLTDLLIKLEKVLVVLPEA
ncbi:hypothetical protein [Rhodoferax sp. U11-2br]|uniref:hypothetical protein n=1 Tax=Rhodoferax sp. U11-2br TaxID=2838878 RepID=UPI001BED0EA9|nr:hypothetical protein [Rhodoferax sp. U11-2br]MBT3066111.1 hypothetical protein [Rhodoferax sp. U11-2br]